MAALVVLIKLICLGGAEGRVVVTAEDAWLETSACEESKDPLQVIEESVLIACLDWVAKEVFAAGIAKCDELTISLDALWPDWSDIVVAYALPDFPLGFVTFGFEGSSGALCRGPRVWSIWYLGGMWSLVVGWLWAVAPLGVG